MTTTAFLFYPDKKFSVIQYLSYFVCFGRVIHLPKLQDLISFESPASPEEAAKSR